MGLFGKKRPLPQYFIKDQVGGLSHLLRTTVKDADISRYRDYVFTHYMGDDGDDAYPVSCFVGLYVLMEPDKRKYETMDKLMRKYLQTTPPRLTNTADQGLLSLLIFRAIVHKTPFLELLPGAATRDRAMHYVQAFYDPMEAMGKDYLRSIGIPVMGADDPDNEEFL